MANLGIDGSAPNAGPNSAGPLSGQTTVPLEGTTGPWTDETDIRPTLMYLTGLKDDYTEDGRVISQVLAQPGAGGISTPPTTALGACYKQLNSSVGELGTATLQAATSAIESTSPGDAVYTTMDQALSQLDRARDHLAEQVKNELWSAEFAGGHINGFKAALQTGACLALIDYADHLAVAGAGVGSGDGGTPLPQLPFAYNSYNSFGK